jgi:hypothetical protein
MNPSTDSCIDRIDRPILPPRNGIDDETSLNLHWKQSPMLATAPNFVVLTLHVS